jgi:hypothetical protein
VDQVSKKEKIMAIAPHVKNYRVSNYGLGYLYRTNPHASKATGAMTMAQQSGYASPIMGLIAGQAMRQSEDWENKQNALIQHKMEIESAKEERAAKAQEAKDRVAALTMIFKAAKEGQNGLAVELANQFRDILGVDSDKIFNAIQMDAKSGHIQWQLYNKKDGTTFMGGINPADGRPYKFNPTTGQPEPWSQADFDSLGKPEPDSRTAEQKTWDALNTDRQNRGQTKIPYEEFLQSTGKMLAPGGEQKPAEAYFHLYNPDTGKAHILTDAEGKPITTGTGKPQVVFPKVEGVKPAKPNQAEQVNNALSNYLGNKGKPTPTPRPGAAPAQAGQLTPQQADEKLRQMGFERRTKSDGTVEYVKINPAPAPPEEEE